MAAVVHQQVGALAQRRRQVEPRNAAAGPAPDVALAADNDRGPVKLVEHTRRHDTHHADMPHQLALHDDEVGLRVKLRPQGAGDLLHDAALDFLPFAVVRVEVPGDGQGLHQVACEEQAQGFLGVLEPAGGIEPRAQLKTHFVGANFRLALCDLLERDQPRPARRAQPLQAGGDQDAVLTRQRGQVRHRAERDQVEQRAQIVVRRAGHAGFAPAFHQRVGQFEGQARRAKFAESRSPALRLLRVGSGTG